MIVILEGVDGSGKTTLWKQLGGAGYNVYRFTKEDIEDYWSWEHLKLLSKNNVTICDRSFLTDVAYRLYDGKSRNGMDLFKMCQILENDCKIIFLESGTEYDDSVRRGENNITSRYENIRIRRNYKIIADALELFTDVKIMHYNWHINDVSDVINFINEGKEENNGVR